MAMRVTTKFYTPLALEIRTDPPSYVGEPLAFQVILQGLRAATIRAVSVRLVCEMLRVRLDERSRWENKFRIKSMEMYRVENNLGGLRLDPGERREFSTTLRIPAELPASSQRPVNPAVRWKLQCRAQVEGHPVVFEEAEIVVESRKSNA